MKISLLLALVASVCLLMGAAGGKKISAESGTQAGQSAESGQTAKAAAVDGKGAQLFDTHCGRCHKPPEDLSPRVAPAVLSHMRTRAMLSREDEELILKFLAP